VAVDAAVRAALQRFQVLGFYADPPHFQDYVDRWMAEFGPRLRVRASAQRPMEPNRPISSGYTSPNRRGGRRQTQRATRFARQDHAALAAVLAYEAQGDTRRWVEPGAQGAPRVRVLDPDRRWRAASEGWQTPGHALSD
jgi:hypothetical protein